MPVAAYDEIADWYEENFGTRPDDPLEFGRVLRDLLGPGGGTCLEIGCGTGTHADRVRALGWTAVGVDLSAGMLRHGAPRLPTARADARRLPVRDSSVPAVLSAMVHTDMPAYPDVLHEVARVLRPGGVLVHVGVHRTFTTSSWWSANPPQKHVHHRAGLRLERFAEGGRPTPTVLGVRAVKG